jgi:prepilin-type N-terminal cleavage/methylation domain-containing protein
MNKIHGYKQGGFTLVEIAIVLVIIGLLLGGVLKGTELIENSKVKKAANEINGVSASYNAYIDRYNRVPGDDGDLATLRARGGAWADVTQAGNRNGVLNVTLGQTFNGRAESTDFWQHLKASGYIKGNAADEDAAALPSNAFGGLIGVTNRPMGGGLNGVKVCLSQVPGKSAVALDNQIDDGRGQSGSVRATLGVAGQNTNPASIVLADDYTEENEYTVCVKM